MVLKPPPTPPTERDWWNVGESWDGPKLEPLTLDEALLLQVGDVLVGKQNKLCIVKYIHYYTGNGIWVVTTDDDKAWWYHDFAILPNQGILWRW